MPKIKLTYAEWQIVLACMNEYRVSVAIDNVISTINSQLDNQEH